MGKRTKDVEGQGELIPDLGNSAADKALVKAAKDYAKAKAARDAVLSTEKEKVDGKMQKLIDLMHAADPPMTKFRHDGIVVEIIQSKEKATVHILDDDDDDDDSEPDSGHDGKDD